MKATRKGGLFHRGTENVKRLLLLAGLFAASCASTQTAATSVAPSTPAATAATPCRATDATLNATLWMQTSAEYTAIAREVYGTALRTLDTALADHSWTALSEQAATAANLPPAVIVDIDETVLDTSAHQGHLLKTNGTYSEAEWHEYAMHDISRPMQAALDALNAIHARGVRIFYITNRYAEEKDAVRKTLDRYAFPFDRDEETLITRGERPEWKSSDKSARRSFVAAHYRVLALFGDDLNDFVPAAGKSIAERQALLDRYNENWGRTWYVLPNPIYGSWERSMLENPRGLSPCEEYERKLEKVREQ
jgi:5'-nucleotidase (lipoprotein e(P4) family)